MAEKIVKRANLNLVNLGKADFCQKMKTFSANQDLEKLAGLLGCGLPTLNMILEALQQNLHHDLRAEYDAPLFKVGLTKVENLRVSREGRALPALAATPKSPTVGSGEGNR